MQSNVPPRQYVILRPLAGSAGGFIRLEAHQGRCCITIRASQVPAVPLRALLLCGDADTGAVLDLGLMRSLGRRQASLYRDDLPLSYLYAHAAALCSDWPEVRMILCGNLASQPQHPLWQLSGLVKRYLSVPAPDTGLPDPLDIRQDKGPALCILLRER